MSKKTVRMFCKEVNKAVLATYILAKTGTPSKVVNATFSSCSESDNAVCTRGIAGGKSWEDGNCIAFNSADSLVEYRN